jgi:hypothetical protein
VRHLRRARSATCRRSQASERDGRLGQRTGSGLVLGWPGRMISASNSGYRRANNGFASKWPATHAFTNSAAEDRAGARPVNAPAPKRLSDCRTAPLNRPSRSHLTMRPFDLLPAASLAKTREVAPHYRT